MKTLVIHPKDSSTTFLSDIYSGLPDVTMFTGGLSRLDLQKHISNHSRVILCGHGSPSGLFGVGQFPSSNGLIIDKTMMSSLRNKPNTLYIWCNADVFVRRHGLSGFYTGMFLSQMSECLWFRVKCSEEDINESNLGFAKIVAQHIEEPPIVFYRNVLVEYEELSQSNPVARYNCDRLFLNRFEPHLFLDKVGKIL